MISTRCWVVLTLLSVVAAPAMAQSFRVQCPTSTPTHPTAPAADPAYTGPTYPTPATPTGNPADYTTGKTGPANGAIKCQQISGGDGYATMADGTQTYLFSFGPLSGIANISQGLPGTTPAGEFNTPIKDPSVLVPGFPTNLTDLTVRTNYGNDAQVASAYNGAIGLVNNNVAYTSNVYSIFAGTSAAAGVTAPATTVTVVQNSPVFFKVGDSVVIAQGTGTDLNGYTGTFVVTAIGLPNNYLPGNYSFQYTKANAAGLAEVTESADGTASSVPTTDGHVDPRQIMDVGGHERQHSGAADGDRRGRRVLPDADQRRHDHAPRPVRAAHRPLPRLSERFLVLRRRAGCVGRHQHRRQLHLLLPGARCRDVLLALPHHAARASADGHGRADLRASAAEPGAVGP